MAETITLKYDDEEVKHEVLPDGSTFNYQGYKYHIVKSFYDEGTNEYIYVTRYYGKHKQWWHYEIWDAIRYDYLIRKIR